MDHVNSETVLPEDKGRDRVSLIPVGKELPIETPQDMNQFRSTSKLIGADHDCLACGEKYERDSQSDDGEYPRGDFQLCNRCFVRLYVMATPEGIQAVQKMLRGIVPPAYQRAEFNTMDVSKPGGRQVAAARDAVASWAQGLVSGSTRSLYLYSKPGSHGSGCGNGKTYLAWAAFKFVARRIARLDSYPDTQSGVVLPCRFLDVRQLVNEFRRKLKDCCDDQIPEFRYPDHSNCFRCYSFDQYLSILAGCPMLILDDLGQGDLRGMVGETYERLLDQRFQLCRPTLFTSNYSPAGLHDRMGNRLASRVFRGDCTVVDLRAPDYCLTNSQGLIGG